MAPCTAAEQHPLLLKQEGTIDVAVDCMTAIFNEGRPGMLLEEDVVKAQRALISIMLELAEVSGCAHATHLAPLLATTNLGVSFGARRLTFTPHKCNATRMAAAAWYSRRRAPHHGTLQAVPCRRTDNP